MQQDASQTYTHQVFQPRLQPSRINLLALSLWGSVWGWSVLVALQTTCSILFNLVPIWLATWPVQTDAQNDIQTMPKSSKNAPATQLITKRSRSARMKCSAWVGWSLKLAALCGISGCKPFSFQRLTDVRNYPMQRTAERETTRKRKTHIEPAQQSPKPWAKAEACSNTGKQR